MYCRTCLFDVFAGKTYSIADYSGDGHFDGCHPCPDELDGGLISLFPTFSVMDLPFVWLDGVFGFTSVHIHTVHIIIIGVDFSAHSDDAGFFQGFSTWIVVPLCNRALEGMLAF